MQYLFRLLIFLFFAHKIHMGGSPVLIKMDGKKGGKGKGNLILISGGKCGSPTLIKGGGKKGGGEMILVGGQNGDCDKPKVQVVKQFVPVPYYVPKPIFKYILRHHYVPVRQVVVKPVPVPYPVKSYGGGGGGGGGYKNGGGGGGYGGGGGGGYGGGTQADYGSGGGGGGGYDGGDNSYSGSSSYGKYVPYDDKSGMMAGYGNSYKRQLYESSYIPSTTSSIGKFPYGTSQMSASKSTNAYATASALHGNNLKASASDNYYNYYNSKKAYTFNDDYGGQVSASNINSGSNNGYPMYAPVYEGPNGQLYSNYGQMYPSPYVSNGTAQMLTSAIPKSSYSSMSMTSQPSTMHAGSTMSLAPTATSPSSSNTMAYKKAYKTEIERAKKMLTGFGKREDDSSSSEEDSTEKNISM